MDMMRKMVIIIAILILAMLASGTTAFGAEKCTVNYFYTSEQNPEPVPAATKGSRNGSKWSIKPAGPTRSSYTKTIDGKTITYTFDGWYTNINCKGTRYLPCKESTLLVPASSNGKYTLNLYGRWVYSESNNAGAQSTTTATKPASTTKSRTPATQSTTTQKKDTAASPKNDSATVQQKTKPVKGSSGKYSQKITAISAYSFSGKGNSRALHARSSSGLELKYTSNNPKVVSVDDNGLMKSRSEGNATITIVQEGDGRYEPAEMTVAVSVAGYRGRKEALAEWRHLLIDTFFHVNDRKYSFAAPGKYWKNSADTWNGKTGRNGDTQSCITLPTVSLKRTGIISPRCGSIWLSSNMASTPNGTVMRLKRTSPMLSISYPHKSLKVLARNGQVKYGDILCRSGHTFVYMGKDSDGHPLVYESGTHRDIGHGTRVTWGHHSGGHANKLTGKINKQIRKSNAVGKQWRRGLISDAAFKGHRAYGNNLNKPIHIVCSINTFQIRTSCVNGTITPGNTYMAGQNVSISYSPLSGRTLDYIKIDGKKTRSSRYKSGYTFKKIRENHSIAVVYR